MRLFKQKEEKKSCCCQGDTQKVSTEKKVDSKNESTIKILGSGCAKCNQLEKETRLAISEKGLNLDIEHVTDFADIASYGVMSTPALVINNKVVSYGKVLKSEEIKVILEREL